MTDAVSPQPEDASTDACDFHVVAIGASAGGLEALEAFFRATPTDTGAAFVVVQHLSPDFKSHMEQLLARQTSMPIHRVENGMEVRPNSIYLIPPRKEMIVSKRKLLLTDREPSQSLSHPIDLFFRSVANDLGRLGVAVVLSGTGSDGSRGIRDVHESGGLVLCQDEQTAAFNGMPINAQETGVVDVVLAPEAMGPALERYITDALSPEVLAEQELPDGELEGMEKVFDLLRSAYGLDFANYRATTIGRRVRRRMAINQKTELAGYVEQLLNDREELDLLYHDLLIGVTRFFRDPEFFESLAQSVLPDLLSRKDSGEPLRGWISGCATGEEAYSVAIAIDEAMTRSGYRNKVKLFATDVHKGSLDTAARGLYPAESLATLSEERRNRYFTETPAGWQVASDLRQMIVFAPHNLLQDAPFTQLDLVTCRNLLIYFQPQSQKKALSFFHFALRTGGTLALGPSESAGELSDEFSVVDKRWKIYKKRRDVRLATDVRLDFSTPTLPQRALSGRHRGGSRDGAGRLPATYEKLLDSKMPPSFLVSESGELLHTYGGAEKWLRQPGGATSRALADLVHSDLRTSISAAVQHALREGEEVKFTGLPSADAEPGGRLRLIVTPLHDAQSGKTDLLVELQPTELSPSETLPDETEVGVDQLTRQHVTSLESELRTTQENLQATVEELETANEELQATNEELVASNEELQSTNEELHSVNEELHTVNAEHQRKIDELTRVTEDLDNLLASIQVGVIFLDSDLRVRRFTPNIADSFNLIPQDIGRRIDTFSSKLDYGDLLADLQAVLEGKGLVEREVTDLAGKRYWVRLLEFRSPSSASGGVLLTLVDIESLRTAEGDLEQNELLLLDTTNKLREERERLQLALQAGEMGAWDWDLRTGKVAFDAAEFEITGLGKPGEPIDAEVFFGRVHEDDRPGLKAVLDRCIEQRDSYDHSFRFTTPDGVTKWLLGRGKVLFDDNEPVRFVGVNFDITHQKELVAELKKARADAESANVAKSAFLANMSHELRTPLSAVLGFADILLSEIDDETNRERVSTIRSNGAYLLSLLNDILDLSKIEAGKLTVQPSDVAVVDLLLDVARLMRVRAEAKDLKLDFSLRNSVPHTLVTDPRRLRQVLVNLLGNAVKFTDAGRVSLAAGVASDDGQQWLEIEVIDTGAGIEEEALKRVFRPFEQAEGRLEATAGGVGLGLSISRLLAQQLGGDLTVESRLNEGSRFTLRLPLEQASEEWIEPTALDGRPTAEKADRASGDNHRLDGRRILVADDRRDIRHVAEYFLGRAGADVTPAGDGREAIEAVREAEREGRPIDLVLMDMQMPEIDGYEATKQLVESGFDRPIVALTAAAMKGERERCLTAGCVDYLTKPIDGASLVEVCAARLAAAAAGT